MGTITSTPPTSATQRARWDSFDRKAWAAVNLTTTTDDRGAFGWTWELSYPTGENTGTHYTGAGKSDLIFGWDTEPTKVLETLASFLGAWREGHEYGIPTYGQSENADLFPVACLPFLAWVEELEIDTMTEVGHHGEPIWNPYTLIWTCEGVDF